MGDAAAGEQEEPTGPIPSGSAGTPEALADPPDAAAPGRPGPRQGRGRSWRLLALLGVVGPLGYLVLVTVLGLLWGGYHPVRDTQSELGAVDAPYRLVMNLAGFMGIGVSILAFAAAYHRLLGPSPAKTLATGLLVVAGVGMVVVGFFPCDAGCVDVTGTGRLHSIFSMPGAIGLPAAAMLSALTFRSDGRFSVAWQVVSFWLGLAALVSGPLIAAELVQGANGLLQRAAMWPPLAWMAATSLKLYALGPPATTADPTRVDGTAE